MTSLYNYSPSVFQASKPNAGKIVLINNLKNKIKPIVIAMPTKRLIKRFLASSRFSVESALAILTPRTTA